MARFSRGTALILLIVVALSCLVSSADASFLDTLRAKLATLTTVTTALKPASATSSDAAPEKPKRVGKRVAVIGMSGVVVDDVIVVVGSWWWGSF